MTSAAAPAPAKDWYRALRRLSSEEFRDLKQIAIPAVAKQQDSANLFRFLNNIRAIMTDSRARLGDLRGCPPWLIALHYSLRTAVNLADPGQDYPQLREMLLTKSEILHFGCPDTYLRDFTDINASKQLPAEPSVAPPVTAPPQTPKVTPVSDHPAGSKSRKAGPAKVTSSSSLQGPAQPGSPASTKSTKSGGGPRYGPVPKEVPQVIIIKPAPASGSKRKEPDTPAEDEEPKGKKGKKALSALPKRVLCLFLLPSTPSSINLHQSVPPPPPATFLQLPLAFHTTAPSTALHRPFNTSLQYVASPSALSAPSVRLQSACSLRYPFSAAWVLHFPHPALALTGL
ncbi:hypothetical protein R3P38DRAFT_2806875 [Favolaschia claudopus]|uniref:Uncharacterized protein n=1 Tax=Favolaschia claudopus TaxID=2862362 RepID=A0AAV9ZIM5_9AGAR